MTDFHNTIIDMIMDYLEGWEDQIIECYHTYDDWGNKTEVYDEIKEWIGSGCNHDNFEENYYDFDLSKMSADTVLEIQKTLVDEYGMECVGDSLFKKEHLVIWYMMSNDVVNEIKGKYDIIKIQRLWRGYDCRWKTLFINEMSKLSNSF